MRAAVLAGPPRLCRARGCIGVGGVYYNKTLEELSDDAAAQICEDIVALLRDFCTPLGGDTRDGAGAGTAAPRGQPDTSSCAISWSIMYASAMTAVKHSCEATYMVREEVEKT